MFPILLKHCSNGIPQQHLGATCLPRHIYGHQLALIYVNVSTDMHYISAAESTFERADSSPAVQRSCRRTTLRYESYYFQNSCSSGHYTCMYQSGCWIQWRHRRAHQKPRLSDVPSLFSNNLNGCNHVILDE